MNRSFIPAGKNMMKLHVCVALLAIAPLADLRAQTLLSPALQDSKPVQHKPQVKKVTIHPAAEPDPALKYRFWPAPEFRSDDDPAPMVNRAILLVVQARNTQPSRSEFADRFSEWSTMPLSDLPEEEVSKFIDRFGGSALKELARAENHMRLDYDLQLDDLSTPEIVSTLLPEFQEMRHLARLLKLRIRLAIAQQRWDDLDDDLRIGFRLADVAGHSTEFLVGRLVGFAISGMMLESALEAMQQPDCPNLYWALASLPETRLSETRDSIEFESVLISRLIRQPPSLPDHEIGAEAARQYIRQLASDVYATMTYTGQEDVVAANFLSGVYVVTMADASRDLLASTTHWGERAQRLSAAEAVLRATHLRLARIRDDWVKWSLLPPEVYDEFGAERRAAMRGDQDQRDALKAMITMITPAVDAARRAGRRVQQTRNLLICIEALRMHAAENGELPVSIDKLRPVPAWEDAIAQKPFGYQRTSRLTATLTRQPRWPSDPETTFQIELTKGNH